MLDESTCDIIKKVHCGFFPVCVKSLDKDALVIGGGLFKPKGHNKEDKLMYVWQMEEKVKPKTTCNNTFHHLRLQK